MEHANKVPYFVTAKEVSTPVQTLHSQAPTHKVGQQHDSRGPLMREKSNSLPTRIRDKPISGLAIHVDAHPTVSGSVLVPPACLWVGVEVSCWDEESKATIIQLLWLGRVLVSQHRLGADGVYAISRDDDVTLNRISGRERNRGCRWILEGVSATPGEHR